VLPISTLSAKGREGMDGSAPPLMLVQWSIYGAYSYDGLVRGHLNPIPGRSYLAVGKTSSSGNWFFFYPRALYEQLG